jgi:hypothetical protein
MSAVEEPPHVVVAIPAGRALRAMSVDEAGRALGVVEKTGRCSIECAHPGLRMRRRKHLQTWEA